MLSHQINEDILREMYNPKKINEIHLQTKIDLEEKPGIYAFWWMGDKQKLLTSYKEIELAGPGGDIKHLRFKDWWPADSPYPCLYVGKTTNLKNRFGLHIKSGSKGVLHPYIQRPQKAKAKTTTCQLRYGIEHIFRDEKNPLDIISNDVGFSYSLMGDNKENDPVHERFYLENLLIGHFRPWFNLDSER